MAEESPKLEQGPRSGENVVELFRPDIDADVVIAAFHSQHGKELGDKIQSLPYFQQLVSHYGKKYPDLTEQKFLEVFLEHEKRFIDHLLRRLTEILNQAQESGNLDEGGIIFNIRTNMLYDIDDTIGGILFAERFGIRPACVLIFRFIAEKLPKIKIGLLSTREHSIMEKQLRGEQPVGSLREIAEFITGGVEGVYARGGLGGMAVHNKGAFDSSIYPDWQSENDLEYLLVEKLGLDPVEAQDVIDNQWPQFLTVLEKVERLNYPNLYLIDGLERDLEKIFDYDIAHQWLQKIVYELMLLTEEVAKAIDDGESMDARKSGLVERINKTESLDGFPADMLESLKPIIEKGISALWDAIDNIRDGMHCNRIPPELTGRQEILQFIGRDQVQIILSMGLTALDMNIFKPESDSASNKLRARMLIDIGGSRIFQPIFQNALARKVSEVYDENQEHKKDFESQIAEIFGIPSEKCVGDIATIMQRLAACRRQLDGGSAQVVIAIDNQEVAEKFDQLLQGKIPGDDFELIDGYKLFGLEKYRGRLHIIHVGERAEYNEKALGKSVALALAA